MFSKQQIVPKGWLAAATLAFGLVAGTAWADVDPPDRVARVAYLRGNVSFQAAGDDQWVQMSLNRPIITGDRVYADRDSRAELEIGAATVRFDSGTTASLLNIDDEIAQIELTEGTLNLHVRRVFQGQSYEIDTPTLAFVIRDPGDYRIDIAPNGDSTMITVFNGGGDIYGEGNARYSVRSGNSYKFHDSSLRDYEVFDLPRRDDFDQWCMTRNDRYERAVSRRYVSEDVIGYADLDDYGSWSSDATYGSVWYPSRVEAGWTPYRSGHWSWVGAWGWTWVDNSPWGFAPFHYGRWAYVGNRWGWCPGPIRQRPVYAPALVAFVGGNGWGVSVGGGGPVGWFPLGPRDVYVPWYRASRTYFTNVNVRNTTIINNTYITNVYNNYSRGGPITNVNYTYRNANAVTAVPRNVFVGAGAVGGARVQVNEARLRNAQVVSRVGIMPDRASFVGGAARGAAAPAAALDRRVIARSAPPREVPMASRLQAIQRNDAQPLSRGQLREMPAARGNAAAPGRGAANDGNLANRVRVVGQGSEGKPQPLPIRGMERAPSQAGAGANRGPGNGAAPTDLRRNQPDRANSPALNRTGGDDTRAPLRRGAPAERGSDGDNARGSLPSSRFAPHRGSSDAAPSARSNASQPVERRMPVDRNDNGAASRRMPAERDDSGAASRRAPIQRGNSNDDDPRALRSSRFAPRAQDQESPRSAATPNRSSMQSPRSIPARDDSNMRAPIQRTAAPRVQQNVERSSPEPRMQPRANPYVERAAPQRQERAAPRFERPAQQLPQRSAPAPQPRTERAAPQMQQRAEPAAPRYERPAQQFQQRSAPQPQRSAPAPQQRSAPAPQQSRSESPQNERRRVPQRDRHKDE